MSAIIRKIGLIILIVGILLLALAIVLGFTVGTIAVPILFSSSILLNSAGLTMLRGGRKPEDEEQGD